MSGKKKLRIAIVGTDSLRGKEIKNVLGRKKFPLKDIFFFDPDVKEQYSKLTNFREEARVIQHLDKDSLLDADLVLLAAGKEVNRRFGILAHREKKFRAIDLSETFNTEEKVPLVVAGVNDEIIRKETPSLIANPHPATVVLAHLFHIILGRFGILKAISFILQPVSAFEESGIKELANQSFSLLSSSSMSKEVFKEQVAFNILSHIERLDKNGFSSVERQIDSEIDRVLGQSDFPFSLSLVQAPVFHTYSIMTYLELKKKADISGLRNLFKESAFFKLSPSSLSSPVSVAGKEEIFVGQIKRNQSLPNSFWIWTIADNLTRGSALNAFEIAKKIQSCA
jgi:aspartate-semialdehyde dehydrogenase